MTSEDLAKRNTYNTPWRVKFLLNCHTGTDNGLQLDSLYGVETIALFLKQDIIYESSNFQMSYKLTDKGVRWVERILNTH